MTDASPLLPSQVTDVSSEAEEKPMPCWRKIIRLLFKFYFLYIGPLITIMVLVPYFHGMQCQQLNPDTLIIGIILFSAGVINSFLTFVHNCKIGKSLDPIQLVYEKEKGEMYKGHKFMARTNSLLGLVQLAMGIWAFVYALQNQDVKDIDDCATFLAVLLITGIICVSVGGLIVLFALYIGLKLFFKKKGSSEE